jgi:signal transduction histidine kinase
LFALDGPEYEDRWAALALTQRLAGIGTLAASVAHELNNPISIITTACSSLEAQVEEQSLSDETLRRQLEIIEQSAWRCARLIQALRSYAHPNARPEICDLNSIVEQALALVAHQFQRQHNIAIHKELASGLRQGLWEPNQIEQVLINLLTNARDALPPDGGRITIRTWRNDESNGQMRVFLSVEDTGPGIPEDVLPRIFEPFFTTKAMSEGTGLGLSIAADIVSQHQGRIWAESVPGGGARFTLELPCYVPASIKEPDLGARLAEEKPLAEARATSGR